MSVIRLWLDIGKSWFVQQYYYKSSTISTEAIKQSLQEASVTSQNKSSKTMQELTRALCIIL